MKSITYYRSLKKVMKRILGGLAFIFIGAVIFFDSGNWFALAMAFFSSLYALRYVLALGKNSYYLIISKDGITIRRMYVDLFIPKDNIKRFSIQRVGNRYPLGKHSLSEWVIFLIVKNKLQKGNINKYCIQLPAPINYDSKELRNALIDLAGT